MTARLVVLASGGGTNCQALIQACQASELDAQIVAVITNNADAGVLQRARNAKIATRVVTHASRAPEQRRREDDALIDAVTGFAPDLVVLAGWMRILGASVGEQLRMINLHPALPGELPGTNAIERAFAEWHAGKRDRTGIMVHWVPDAGVDVGPVITTVEVAFEPGDTLDTFAERMHAAEHRLIVQGTALALGGGKSPT